jgi:hypothetical protein
MKPSIWESKSLVGRLVREAAIGHGLFSTKDPETWKAHFEDLGKLCAEAWRDDLPEGDREWAAAHRERFERWVGEPRSHGDDARGDAGSSVGNPGALPGVSVPPWPMLLEAVESAFHAFVAGVEEAPAGEGEHATAHAASRLHRTYLWRTLSADNTAEAHRAEALRAFQRGFRLGRGGGPSLIRRPIPPMLDPPYFWGAILKNACFPGPSATRDLALRNAWFQCKDPKESVALHQALRELYASAWREDVPEEDREWAAAYRQICSNWAHRRRQAAVARSAYEGYLQSSDGIFQGEPAPPWPSLSHHTSEPWRAFVDRVDDGPEGESELATAEAAVRDYWDAFYREAPPWDGDPDQVHWLAAVRAARKALSALAADAPLES